MFILGARRTARVSQEEGAGTGDHADRIQQEKELAHPHAHTHAYTHPFLRGCAVRAYNKKPDNNTEWHLRVGTEYSPAQNSVGGVPGYAT